MKIRLLLGLVGLGISFVLSAFAQHPPPTGHFVTFDPPGSMSTVPSAITAAGAVVGSYSDSSGGSTASCAMLTAASLRSTHRAPHSPRLQLSIPRERSLGPTTTQRA
jgi:hypothetical protein